MIAMTFLSKISEISVHPVPYDFVMNFKLSLFKEHWE